MSIEGQGHFFTIYYQVLYVLCFTRPRYQVSVYRTIGPLVYMLGLFVYEMCIQDSNRKGKTAFQPFTN